MRIWMVVPAAAIAAAAVLAQAGDGHQMMEGHKAMSGMGDKAVAGATHHGIGIVQKVDADAGKVTLKHEAIDSLGWPAMTMAFDVKDKSLLRDLQPGSKVDFTLAQYGSRYVIAAMK